MQRSVRYQVCEAIKGRVPASSFLRAHFTDKEGCSRSDRSPSHYTQTTDAALIQRLLQMETTLNGLPSEIQRIKEDTRHKILEKLLHEKIKEQAEQIQQLETKLRESKKHSCSLLKSIMIKRTWSINTALKDHCKQSKCCMTS